MAIIETVEISSNEFYADQRYITMVTYKETWADVPENGVHAGSVRKVVHTYTYHTAGYRGQFIGSSSSPWPEEELEIAEETTETENTMNNVSATTDRNIYGATESNGLVDGAGYHKAVKYATLYSLKGLADAGGKITRLRFLTEYVPMHRTTYMDVSYCHGQLPDGTVVPVQCTLGNMIPKYEIMGELIKWAKEEGVYAKGIGLLDKGNWSVL